MRTLISELFFIVSVQISLVKRRAETCSAKLVVLFHSPSSTCFYGAWSAKAQRAPHKSKKWTNLHFSWRRAFKVKSDFKDAQLDRGVCTRERRPSISLQLRPFLHVGAAAVEVCKSSVDTKTRRAVVNMTRHSHLPLNYIHVLQFASTRCARWIAALGNCSTPLDCSTFYSASCTCTHTAMEKRLSQTILQLVCDKLMGVVEWSLNQHE